MGINVPYDELTLKIALMGASSKLENEELQKELLSKISDISVKTMAELNVKVSEFHGITVPDLINSPNYEKMKAEYANHNLALIRNIYLDAGFSDKESWALVCLGLGQLND